VRKLNVAFLGCGFLASHLMPHVLPFTRRLILLDRDRVEPANYENCVLPKGYTGRRKVSALAALAQALASVEVVPVHLDVRRAEQLLELHARLEPEFCFVTFDNARARLVAKEYALEAGVPTLFVGVTVGHAYVDWAEHVVLPEETGELERVEEEMRAIRDVCGRLEFRGLGLLASALAYRAFTTWLWTGRRLAYMARLDEHDIDVATIELGR